MKAIIGFLKGNMSEPLQMLVDATPQDLRDWRNTVDFAGDTLLELDLDKAYADTLAVVDSNAPYFMEKLLVKTSDIIYFCFTPEKEEGESEQ